jgi:nitronate monooxygenase
MSDPIIIQGGMGVAVSGWRLARAVSLCGQLGVVSGTLLAVVLTRRLQLGDSGGEIRRALAHFPVPAMAERILERYYIPGGKAPGEPFKLIAMPSSKIGPDLAALIVAGNFVEVFLAKEGHNNPVGINLLEKIQVATLPSLYGAMLAGVDVVLMGAGIPRNIPGALDRMANGEVAELRLDVEGELAGAETLLRFAPREFLGNDAPPVLQRPRFYAIVSSAVLATTLARKSNGRVDGFVVESDAAGGHNAPPRGPLQLDAAGEPIYGPRDAPDLEKFRALGVPFWVAGSHATPQTLQAALDAGAAGVQIGTAFAFCEESGIEPELKQRACAQSRSGQARVSTDPFSSPTGFPFKALRMDGTISEPDVYENRNRICDLGYLRHPYQREDGTLGYRCAAEPVDDYVSKGGAASEAAGRKCLCNGLLATVGLGQTRAADQSELPLITAGRDVAHLGRFLQEDELSYSAADVIRSVLDRS